jgi:hypothetical protein
MVQVTGTRIANRVKRQFGDESGVQVTDNDIINWLNDALTEAAVQNESINLSSGLLASVAGADTLLLVGASTEFAAVHSLHYRPSPTQPYSPLTFVSNRSFSELFPTWGDTATGVPLFYTKHSGNEVKIYPSPAISDAQGFIVYYNSFFDEYLDLEDTMNISPRYFQYLLEYCLMKAYEMDENWEAADRKASFIQATLNSLHTNDVNLNQNSYPVLSSTPEDM